MTPALQQNVGENARAGTGTLIILSREQGDLLSLLAPDERAPLTRRPDEMILCARVSALRLSRAGCARCWEAAQERQPKPWEPLHPCLTCPTGATHAGRPGDGRFGPAEALRTTCERCGRPAGHCSGGRMVGGRFCLSCYNRNREVIKGRNARGTRPRLVLRDVVLDVEGAGGVRRARHRQVASFAEAMLAEARRAGGPLAFLGAPARPAEDGWRPVAHACRSCLGRVVERAGLFRCSDCGARAGTAPEPVCGCGLLGLALPERRRRLFRCRPREVRDPDASAGIVIAFGEGSGDTC